MLSGVATSSKDKKTWKVKVAKQFKKIGGSEKSSSAHAQAQAQSYPEGGSIGAPGRDSIKTNLARVLA